jgi:hypothetical protein
MKTLMRTEPMTRTLTISGIASKLVCLLAMLPMLSLAQVPVDEYGNAIGEYHSDDAAQNEAELELASEIELEDLVGSIALYPDDLLAIILPASTYPLQLVEASRFLADLENDPSLTPDEDWDDSVVALTNYPEVIQLLNDDLDWTWQLGEAVIAQQADVIGAIEVFRDRAYAAGNLQSDEYQQVTHDEGIIEITPVNDDVIYVPYYEPERVVVYQPQPVYYYHPRPYPVYNYPYSYGHTFRSGYFWGVTTAFAIGWSNDYLNVYHHSYNGHPYYGYHYNTNWWYRRPSIHVHNTYYVNNYGSRTNNYYRTGDHWRSNNTRHYSAGQQVTKTRYRPNSSVRTNSVRAASSSSRGNKPASTTRTTNTRNRAAGATAQPSSTTVARNTSRSATVNRSGESAAKEGIRFQQRNGDLQRSAPRSNRAPSGVVRSNSTTRTSAAANIRFKPRKAELDTDKTRRNSNGASRNSTVNRNTLIASNTSAKTSRAETNRQTAVQRRINPPRNTTRVASAPQKPAADNTRRSGSTRQQSAPRNATKSSAPTQQRQRQAAPAQKKPQRADSKPRSSSSDKKVASNSRNNRSGNNKSSQQRRH